MRAHRLGVAISSSCVAAVLRRGSVVLWQDLEAVGDEDAPDPIPALGRLLERLPRPRVSTVSLLAAVGLDWAQYKFIERREEKNSGRGTDSLREDVHRAPATFFLSRSVSLAVSPARPTPSGLWVGAIDRALLESIESLCRAKSLAFRGGAPTVAVLGRILPEGSLRWHDAERVASLSMQGGQTAALRIELALSRAVSSQGDREAIGQAALAAALVEPTDPSVVDPRAELRVTKRARRRRLGLVTTALAAGLGAWLAPVIRPILLDRLGPEERERLRSAALPAERDLRGMTRALALRDSIDSFDTSRRDVPALLRKVASALPDSSALVAVRVDAKGATLVVLTPTGISVQPRLASLDGIASAQLIGAVTREIIAGRALQRIAIALAFVPSPSKGRAR
jgi:hypothetical protein